MSNQRQPVPSKMLLDIEREIDKERKLTRLLKKSVEQWDCIVSDLEKGYGNKLTEEDECKTRYIQQRILNESLQQQIASLKTELRILKHRRTVFLSNVSLSTMADKTMRQHLDHLEKELSSMKGLRSMYERQLDQESEKYYKAKEERDSIIKDVWFQQQSRIDHQEKIDKIMIERVCGPKTSPKRHVKVYQKPKTVSRPKTGRRCRNISLPPINVPSSGTGSQSKEQRWRQQKKLEQMNDSYLNIHERHSRLGNGNRGLQAENELPELESESSRRNKKNLRVRIVETPTEYS